MSEHPKLFLYVKIDAPTFFFVKKNEKKRLFKVCLAVYDNQPRKFQIACDQAFNRRATEGGYALAPAYRGADRELCARRSEIGAAPQRPPET